jgi:hypothetical protein
MILDGNQRVQQEEHSVISRSRVRQDHLDVFQHIQRITMILKCV